MKNLYFNVFYCFCFDIFYLSQKRSFCLSIYFIQGTVFAHRAPNLDRGHSRFLLYLAIFSITSNPFRIRRVILKRRAMHFLKIFFSSQIICIKLTILKCMEIGFIIAIYLFLHEQLVPRVMEKVQLFS